MPHSHPRHFLTTLILAVLLLASCGSARVVPITGRKQHLHYTNGYMANAVVTSYNQEVRQLGISSNKQQTAMVNRVSQRLIQAATTYMSQNGYAAELPDYKWEVHLLRSQLINATCRPGGKIVVYEGILPIAYDDAGLASILGHEIGHAIAQHVSEKMSRYKVWGAFQQLGATAMVLAGSGTDAAQMTVDTSNQILEYADMKYSRRHEHEADHIGLILMAMAGYDPREAPKVWQRMTAQTGDTRMRILSTHPSNAKRMRWMQDKWMSEALRYYKPPKPATPARKRKTK